MKDLNKPLINKIAQSGLITFKLETLFPTDELVVFDLKDYLFRELILREKDFRAALEIYDWNSLKGKNLAVFCSNDAIIPLWAYMLVVSYAQPFASEIFQGSPDQFLAHYFYKKIDQIDFSKFENQRVILKGCADQPIPAFAYSEMTRKLRPIVKSLMFGEPCSTVPIFKKK